MAPLETLHVSPVVLLRFTRTWTLGVANYRLAQNRMLNTQRSFLVASFLMCALPSELLLHDAPVSRAWYHVGALVSAWLLAMLSFILTFQGCVACTSSLCKIQADASMLICDDAHVGLRLWQLTQETDLTCYFAGFVPCTPWTRAAFVVVALLSGAPFFFLDYV
jgi:hypothetical protein